MRGTCTFTHSTAAATSPSLPRILVYEPHISPSPLHPCITSHCIPPPSYSHRNLHIHTPGIGAPLAPQTLMMIFDLCSCFPCICYFRTRTDARPPSFTTPTSPLDSRPGHTAVPRPPRAREPFARPRAVSCTSSHPSQLSVPRTPTLRCSCPPALGLPRDARSRRVRSAHIASDSPTARRAGFVGGAGCGSPNHGRSIIQW